MRGDRYPFRDRDVKAIEQAREAIAAAEKILHLDQGRAQGVVSERVRQIRDRVAGSSEADRIALVIHAREDIRYLLDMIETEVSDAEAYRNGMDRYQAKALKAEAEVMSKNREIARLNQRIGRQRVLLRRFHQERRAAFSGQSKGEAE